MNRKRSVSYKTRSEAIKCCFQERLTFICTRTGHVHFLTFDKVYFVLCIVWIFQIILSLSPSNQSRRLSRLWRDNPSVWLQRLSLSHKLEKISTIFNWYYGREIDFDCLSIFVYRLFMACILFKFKSFSLVSAKQIFYFR